MKKKSLLPLLALVFFSNVAEASVIDTIVGQISTTDYQSYVETLEDFGTRYYNKAGNTNAQNYLFQALSALGLDVALDAFSYNGTQYNVVATLPGVTNPEQVYIIGAHYDSTSTNTNTAPGADDNASGVAAVLEIASVLSRYQFASTIQFILFDAEEQGLKGSTAYAQDARSRGDDIQAMLNFDMIAYTGGNPNEDVEVYGDQWLRDMMIENLAAYTSVPYEAHAPLTYGSDHVAFSSTNYAGSSSLLLIEDSPDEIYGGSNPYYHKTTDTSDRLDWSFATNITIAGAATIAELAQPATLPYLALDFGALGLYLYDGLAWSRLNLRNPNGLAVYNNRVAANFPGFGLYEHDGTAWKKLNARDSYEQMCGTGNALYVDFGPGVGLYRYNGTWAKINANSPKQMWAVGTDLYVDFGAGLGLYKFNGTKWQRLNLNDATDLCAVGSDLYIHFAGVGLYKYDGTWKKINSNSTEGMCAVGSDLYVDFGAGIGLYRYNGSWTQVVRDDPEDMHAVGSILFIDLGASGLYKHEAGKLTRITTANAQGMVTYADKLVVSFPSAGLYEYDGSLWRKLNPNTTENMVAVDLY
jgi:hypothetical protein